MTEGMEGEVPRGGDTQVEEWEPGRVGEALAGMRFRTFLDGAIRDSFPVGGCLGSNLGDGTFFLLPRGRPSGCRMVHGPHLLEAVAKGTSIHAGPRGRVAYMVAPDAECPGYSLKGKLPADSLDFLARVLLGKSIEVARPHALGGEAPIVLPSVSRVAWIDPGHRRVSVRDAGGGMAFLDPGYLLRAVVEGGAHAAEPEVRPGGSPAHRVMAIHGDLAGPRDAVMRLVGDHAAGRLLDARRGDSWMAIVVDGVQLGTSPRGDGFLLWFRGYAPGGDGPVSMGMPYEDAIGLVLRGCACCRLGEGPPMECRLMEGPAPVARPAGSGAAKSPRDVDPRKLFGTRLRAVHMTIGGLAGDLGVSPDALLGAVSGNAGMPLDLALGLEDMLGVPHVAWDAPPGGEEGPLVDFLAEMGTGPGATVPWEAPPGGGHQTVSLSFPAGGLVRLEGEDGEAVAILLEGELSRLRASGAVRLGWDVCLESPGGPARVLGPGHASMEGPLPAGASAALWQQT